MLQVSPQPFGLHSRIRSHLRATRLHLTSAFYRLANALERRSKLALFLLAAVYLPAVLALSREKPLWHDEIITLYIAGAPDLSAMFREMHQVDLNPPLSYLLTRVSLTVFHHSTLACRLPEMVAFFVCMVCLYALVKRRAGTLYGILAATIFFSGLAGELAVDARPYALLLACVSLALLAWQMVRLAGRTRIAGLLLLALAGCGILLSHIFGSLAWAALTGGELAREVNQRRVDGKALLAWCLPLVCVASYLPMLRSHSISLFPAAFQPTSEGIFTFYIEHVDREMVGLALTAGSLSLLLGRQTLRGGRDWLFTWPEWVSIFGLMASAGVLMAYLMVTHGAFFPRYGILASIGVTLSVTALLAWWSDRNLVLPIFGSLLFLLISGKISAAFEGVEILRHVPHLGSAAEPPIEPCRVCRLTAALDPTLPLVDASGLTFIEMDHRSSAADLARVFYLTDRKAAIKYAHATIFEGMATEAQLFPIRANVMLYTLFTQQHRRFFVYGDYDYPEDWLLRKLQADGATLRVVGRSYGQYKDHEIYEASFDGAATR